MANTEKKALNNLEGGPKGKRLENYSAKLLLEIAHTEFDQDARRATIEEDRKKGADFYIFNILAKTDDMEYDIPIDLTMNHDKDNTHWDTQNRKQIYSKHLPRYHNNVDIQYGIRDTNEYLKSKNKKFEKPALVIYLDTNVYTDDDLLTFADEVMPNHWKRVIKEGIEYYNNEITKQKEPPKNKNLNSKHKAQQHDIIQTTPNMKYDKPIHIEPSDIQEPKTSPRKNINSDRNKFIDAPEIEIYNPNNHKFK